MIAAALVAAGPATADTAPLPPAGAQVVWLGEVHDNPDHHRVQAGIVAALDPSALVLEMLEPRHAAAPVDRGDVAAMDAAFEWSARGWPDLAMYAPILAQGAPLYGAALPPDEVRRAVSDGALAVFGTGGARFGLDRPLPPEQQAEREAGQAAAHCEALPEEMLPGFVEAQRLRDAALADAALRALAETGGPVAVIAGTGHVRADWGAPSMVALAAPEVAQWTLGQGEGELDGPFDAVAVADAPERGDPCAAFR
nr:ChaN family lipoprotein [Jannaschia sp. Os4]